MRRCCRITGAGARNALFTASASGKISNTAGSMTAMFAPCAYLVAVTPRTPVGKSYAVRIGSPSLLDLLAFLFKFRLTPIFSQLANVVVSIRSSEDLPARSCEFE